jgi:hypothetical protein
VELNDLLATMDHFRSGELNGKFDYSEGVDFATT